MQLFFNLSKLTKICFTHVIDKSCCSNRILAFIAFILKNKYIFGNFLIEKYIFIYIVKK